MRCQAIVNEFRQCERFVDSNHYFFTHRKGGGLFVRSRSDLFCAKKQMLADVSLKILYITAMKSLLRQ